MPAVPGRPGPRRSARARLRARPGLRSDRGKAEARAPGPRCGSSTPPEGTGPGDGPAATTAARVSPGRRACLLVGLFLLS